VTTTLSLPVRPVSDTGVAVTTLGFGAAGIGNLFSAVSDETAQATIEAALRAGIGYVDTAPHYGQGLSERRTGVALARWDENDPEVPIRLSTKVGRVLTRISTPPPGTERHGFVDGDPFEPHFDYSYDGVMRSFEDSCKRLGRTSVDMLFAHDLGYATHGDDHPRHFRDFMDGGYRAMAELKASGRTRAIGLGVNEWEICEDVMGHADLDVVLLAGRYTLLEQTALDSFLPLCQRKGVSVLAAAPFNSGVITGGGMYNYMPAPQEILDRVAAIRAVCAYHAVPIAAAALQFPLTHPSVACVLTGMVSAAQVQANLKLFTHPIPPALWEDLKTAKLLRRDAPTAGSKTLGKGR
jgi:D-threo-aldose 1-dehydrogenase